MTTTTRVFNMTSHPIMLNNNEVVAPNSERILSTQLSAQSKVALMAGDRVFNTDPHEAQKLGYITISTSTTS